jgi:hypothetical protein
VLVVGCCCIRDCEFQSRKICVRPSHDIGYAWQKSDVFITQREHQASLKDIHTSCAAASNNLRCSHFPLALSSTPLLPTLITANEEITSSFHTLCHYHFWRHHALVG